MLFPLLQLGGIDRLPSQSSPSLLWETATTGLDPKTRAATTSRDEILTPGWEARSGEVRRACRTPTRIWEPKLWKLNSPSSTESINRASAISEMSISPTVSNLLMRSWFVSGYSKAFVTLRSGFWWIKSETRYSRYLPRLARCAHRLR